MDTWITSWLLRTFGVLVLWIAGLVIYRRFFHPLAKIPGPFLPAVTGLPGFYFNFIKSGKWYKEVERLHTIYGPIIRISPNEVHLNDPDNYDKIYSNSSRFYKDPGFYAMYGMEDAMFCTIPNDLHRKRRAPLNPFFSKKAIMECESIVQEKVAKLCKRIRQAIDDKQPIDLSRGFRAISVDVVTDYSFHNPLNLLDQDDFGSWFANMLREGAPMFWIFQQFPFTQTLLEIMPTRVVKTLSSAVASWETFMVMTKVQVVNVKNDIAAGIKPKRRTIFHQLLDSSAEEGHAAPSDSKLADEALSITGAAADSTGNAMSYAIYNVITKPHIYEKVKKELREAFPNDDEELKLSILEQLPYLTGIVKEAQRMSYGVIGRLPRMTPDGGAMFNGYYVPAGTTVSMSTWNMHHNTDAFPNPDTFDPMRWLDPNGARMREKCFVPFSRGHRMCLGHALAMCELYCSIGTVLHKFEKLEPYKVTDEDMVYEDYVGAVHPLQANSFKVVGKM
uniref:CapH n=1 Tax=Capnodium sp. TTI-000886 TaxID=3078996 RepID=A0AA96MN02_9PEZI|nr:CapH [Capnodium sp. TTI-000886]